MAIDTTKNYIQSLKNYFGRLVQAVDHDGNLFVDGVITFSDGTSQTTASIGGSSVLHAQVPISNTQLLNNLTGGITIVSGIVNKIILPVFATILLVFKTTPFTQPNAQDDLQLSLVGGEASPLFFTSSNPLLSKGANTLAVMTQAESGGVTTAPIFDVASVIDSNLVLICGANAQNGDSSFIVNVDYLIVDPIKGGW